MGNPRRHAQVFTPTKGAVPGVWFVGHGSFNLRTDTKEHSLYTIPGWLAGGVVFWCHDKETLKAVVAEMIIDEQKLASIPGLIKAAYETKYGKNHQLSKLPSTYLPGNYIQMYRLTNADDNSMTMTIKSHPNVITVPPGGKFPEKSRTIEQLIEANESLIRRNGNIVHWLACRVHKER
jgi:hypothetical protein